MNGATVGFVLLADTFDDPENARIILLSAAGLVVLGLLIAAGTVWWWRSSEVEHPALGPLEVMGSRSWWKGDYTSRRRRLEAARPEGAEPVDPPATSTLEPVDLKAAALASLREFDDLLEFPPGGAVEPEAEAVVPPTHASSAAEAHPVADHDEEHGDLNLDQYDNLNGDQQDNLNGDQHDNLNGDQHDNLNGGLHGDSHDDSSAADVPRPIDPLLRLQHDE